MGAISHLLFPPYRLDLQNEQLSRADKLIPLRAKPFALLRFMAENSGRLVLHEELRKAIWPTTYVSEGVLRVYLREVRAALEDDPESPRFIETIARRGYRFLVAVERVTTAGKSDAIVSETQTAGATPAMVGRNAELARLRSAFAKASLGARQIVFLNGEAGIGKTTIVEAFLNEAAEPGEVWIGRGQCVEHRGESEPYLPMLDALNRLAHHAAGAQVIETLRMRAPTWLVQMPGVIDDVAYNDLQKKVDGASQQRMLREMADTLEQLSIRRPVVLAFEDLHWSDPSTLTLLDLLARRTERARLLIVATHRPLAILPGEHPLRVLAHELAGRYCEDLSLAPLTAGDVAEYLGNRIEPDDAADAISLDQVARSIHQRTEGNPLYMVTLVSALLHGTSTGSDGAAKRTSRREVIDGAERIVPANITEMISQQFARLDAEEQRLLEVASVAGVEFSAAAVAAGADATLMAVEERCAGLAGRMSFLQDAGDDEWPDGTVSARFRFRHALYREAVYARLTAARRSALHHRIGQRQEAAYGERANEIASELARHFEQGRNFERALRYREQAARNALRRSAPREAIEHLSAALGLLGRLPEGHERLEHELQIRLALGAALQSTKGYGADEVQDAYQRAGELCQRLGETPHLFPALMGLWSFAVGRGEWKRSLELAEKNLRLAQSVAEPAQLARSWRGLGHVQYFLGRFDDARENLERAIALTADSEPRLDTFTYMSNTGVEARSALAWTLELIGYPDQALAMIRKALSVAERLGNVADLIYATYFAAVLYGFRTEWPNAESWARRTVELASEHGLPYYVAMGTHLRGAALAEQGRFDEGLSLMQTGVATSHAIGVEAGLTGMYLMIAENSLKAGQLRPASDAIADGFRFAKSKDEHAWEAELHRVKGELALEQFRRGAGVKGVKRGERDAEEALQAAQEIARAQGSRKWQLRAASSLSNLWKQQKKKKEARQVLSVAYCRFTEGFETTELKAAKSLLAQL
jgi:DNA-binding winged helix-turn-helix (wHTH) protein/predicted ATPase/type II secretory pathway predicted ATPase ExeA